MDATVRKMASLLSPTSPSFKEAKLLGNMGYRSRPPKRSLALTLQGMANRRPVMTLALVVSLVLLWQQFRHGLTGGPLPPLSSTPAPASPSTKGSSSSSFTNDPASASRFQWSTVPLHYPIPRSQMRAPPPPPDRHSAVIPQLQHDFGRSESPTARTIRLARRDAVRANFTHAWAGYRAHAWLRDEVKPLTGGARDPFGGWAATLVDALDTLWIMGLKEEFEEAVDAVARGVDFSAAMGSGVDEINVFETTIRFLGGLLAAYDVSGGRYPVLLQKAVELGDMLYVAFDTPNHLPNTRWKWRAARDGEGLQIAPEAMLVAELGSLTLEFTRLSQLTGDEKYFDVVQRVMDLFAAQQDYTVLPGLFPVVVNARTAQFTEHNGFTIGGMADSMYEYLPKEYILLNGADAAYKDMYSKAITSMQDFIFYRPITKSPTDILLAGDFNVETSVPLTEQTTEPRTQHLSCFAGGMVALAAKALDRPDDLSLARQLVEGCLWGYENAPRGIMPEVLHTTMCIGDLLPACAWDEEEWLVSIADRWGPKETDKTAATAEDAELLEMGIDVDERIRTERLTPGVTSIDDRRYQLRPEMIESVFVLYRLTGDAELLDRAWAVFENVVALTTTEIAHAALDDCTAARPEEHRADRMESFWMAETLKYFYLLFEEPDVVSLDEFVLNTEAHPLRWRE